MIDRSQYGDTRKELQQLQRLTYLLTKAIEGLARGQLEQRQESRRYHSQTRHIVFDGFARGLTEIPRNRFGEL